MKDPLEEASVDVDRRGAALILLAVVVGLVGLAIVRPGARDALLIIFGIVLMVMLHEAGHFLAARRAGMKATEFFVGFGPRLWSFKRGETEYGVKAIPAGGYVRILGMSNLEQPIEELDDDGLPTGKWVHDYTPADEPRTFRRGSYGNRLVVILAGVTVNLIIAFLLFFIVIAGQGRVVRRAEHHDRHHHDEVGRRGRGARTPATGSSSVDGQRIPDWEELKSPRSRRAAARTDDVHRRARRGARRARGDAEGERGGKGFLGVGPTNASSATSASSRRSRSRSARWATSPSAPRKGSGGSSRPTASQRVLRELHVERAEGRQLGRRGATPIADRHRRRGEPDRRRQHLGAAVAARRHQPRPRALQHASRSCRSTVATPRSSCTSGSRRR